MSKKTPLRVVVLFAFVMTLRVSVPARIPREVFAQSGDYIASLEPVQGIIQVQTAQDDPQNAQSWHVITQAIPVAEGDRIRTGRGGLAILTFFEGVEVEIRETSLVVISTLLLPTETDPSFNITVDVLVGSMVSDIEQTMASEDRFEVHTPGATSVVRGTRWWTVVTPNGEAVFAVERGAVTVIPHTRYDLIPAAAPGAEEPSSDESSASVAVPAPALSELAVGMGVLTDRYGTILEREESLQFPAASEGLAALPLPGPECGDGLCGPLETASCTIDCLDGLTLPACGNGTCEPDQGEDLLVCGSDCGPWAGENCGDGTCQGDESGLTCPTDCQAGDYFDPVDPAQCGNAICDPAESTLTCPADCVAAAR